MSMTTFVTNHNSLERILSILTIFTIFTILAPKSAKLTRWSLGHQEFDISWYYRPGSKNQAADCLSRLGWRVVRGVASRPMSLIVVYIDVSNRAFVFVCTLRMKTPPPPTWSTSIPWTKRMPERRLHRSAPCGVGISVKDLCMDY